MMSKTTIGIITATSLLSLLSATIALQTQLANALTGNATQAANQTGEKGQSMLNKTGETLQQVNPFK